jgi:hypothetical protein
MAGLIEATRRPRAPRAVGAISPPLELPAGVFETLADVAFDLPDTLARMSDCDVDVALGAKTLVIREVTRSLLGAALQLFRLALDFIPVLHDRSSWQRHWIDDFRR